MGGSARVLSAGIRHSASQRRRRYLRMTPDPALTRPATRRPGGRPGQHPRRHGPVMPVPRQVRALCRTTCRGRSRYACAGSASNTPPDRRPRRPGSCYLFCMISPIRGDFTGFRVQVPPRTPSHVSDLRIYVSKPRSARKTAGHRRAGSSPCRTQTLRTCHASACRLARRRRRLHRPRPR